MAILVTILFIVKAKMSFVPHANMAPWKTFTQAARKSFYKDSLGIEGFYPIGGGVGVFILISSGIGHGVLASIGAFILAVALGYLAFYQIRESLIRDRVQYHYCKAWGQQTGWEYHSGMGKILPAQNPLKSLGNVARADDGFIFNNYPGGVANYLVFRNQQNQSQESDATKYLVGWIKVDAPFEDMYLAHRQQIASSTNHLKDNIKTRLTNRKIIELESEDFYNHFKLDFPDEVNDLIIRRMFSPAKIDALITGRVPLYQPLTYYNGYVWLVFNTSFTATNLEADLENICAPLEMQARAMRYFLSNVETF